MKKAEDLKRMRRREKQESIQNFLWYIVQSLAIKMVEKLYYICVYISSLFILLHLFKFGFKIYRRN